MSLTGKIGYSDQYKANVLIIPPDATKDDFETLDEQALRHDCLSGVLRVVQFPGGPIEVYTRDALRRSLPRTS